MISAPPETELLYPLSRFRREGGRTIPAYELVKDSEMPEPYRSLLVHNGDMTSRLETFHGGNIVLEVLHLDRSQSAYRREVVLHLEKSGLPVEYGAIEINLDAFQPELREKILEGRLPLGGLLNHYKVNYHSRPRGFFRLAADPQMSTIFGAPESQEFYGRSNELLGDKNVVLARIVEVLRP